jgi:adenylate cyclase class IV
MEVEYKFWAGNLSKAEFHTNLENTVGRIFEPIYVCSCDDYYTNERKSFFVRYRKGGGDTELTLKIKREGNIVRKEINLNLNDNNDSAIVEFLSLSGYEKEFSIFKEAWIWNFEDCDVSYYTLSDGRSVVEVEATEYKTPKDGVVILDKWVKSLNLEKLDREKRSLFEIFIDEKNGHKARS